MPRLHPCSILCLATVSTLALAQTTPAGTLAPTNRTDISANYSKLPISFEPNHGQTDPQVKFLARGNRYGLFLTSTEAVLSLGSAPAPTQAARHTAVPSPASESDVVRMQLRHANSAAAPSGVDSLPGTTNYLIGKDASKWRTAIPTYSKVKFTGVYPGVDLVYYGNQSQLEYDFVVAPNAAPTPIQLHFAGARKLTLNSAGDLVIRSTNGSIAFHKPVVYQDIAGQRQIVASSFALRAHNDVAFTLGKYYHSQPLIIDPVLAYSTYLGGSANTNPSSIAVDEAGNAYITGSTAATDFPVTKGAFQPVNRFSNPFSRTLGTGFVTKISPSGTLVYSTFLGGTKGEYGSGIAVDFSGNAYVTGQTYSADFPVTPDAFQTINRAFAKQAPNAFITKLSSDGSTLLYSSYLGGSGGAYGGDYASGIALDSAGSFYIAGATAYSDFPLLGGQLQSYKGAYETGFVSKFSKDDIPIFSSYFGGSSYDQIQAITVCESGGAVVTGLTDSNDFPVTPGAFHSVASHPAVFVAKLSASGTSLAYSSVFGGSNTQQPGAIAVDNDGNAYVTGFTYSADFPLTPSALYTSNLNGQAFLTKLNASGTSLIYSTFLGGSKVSFGSAVKVDATGNAYVSGETDSSDLPVTEDAIQPTSPSKHGPGFLTEIAPDGSSLLYSTYLGGSSGDNILALAVTSPGQVYVSGVTVGSGFPITPGALQSFSRTKNYYDLNGIVAHLDLINAITAAPVSFSPASGKFLGSVSVSLSDTTPNSTIHYTLDGSVPTSQSPIYNGSFNLTQFTRIAAIATAGSYTSSPTRTDFYDMYPQTPAPTLTPFAGVYPAGTTITISDSIPTATLRYTTDGSTPTIKSRFYTGPITLTANTTIRAIAISTNAATSPETADSYTIK